jgi:peptidoglycan/LPS O-acetylase OafA/YrhL
VNVAFVTAVTAVLSTLSYRYVERPALARKRSWEQGRATVPAPAAAPSAPPATAPLR